MNEIDQGYYFWKRVDMVRPKHVTLKQIVHDAQLNYHLVKVQRSCNRIPKALEAAQLAGVLNVSLEWLLTGKITTSEYQNCAPLLDQRKRQQISRILHVLLASDQQKWNTVEHALGIGSKADL
jgi:hypothetical protein